MKEKRRRVLPLILAASLWCGQGTVLGGQVMKDLPQDYSTEALEAAIEQGLLYGVDGAILPKEELTRAQLAAMLVRAFGEGEEADLSQFSDVESGAWYEKELAMAVERGAMYGDGEKLYPDRPVTREEAFTVLARLLALPKGDVTVLNPFLDGEACADWAKESLAAMVAAGYVHGAEGALEPKANITRADFAVVMHQIVGQYLSESGVYTEVAEGTVVVSAGNVTLRGVEITGDLVIGEGVGEGIVTLEDVTVKGRILIRGGKEVKCTGSTEVYEVLCANGSEKVRVEVEEGAFVTVLSLTDGEKEVELAGTVDRAQVGEGGSLLIEKGALEEVTLSGEKAAVTVGKDAQVEEVILFGDSTKVQAEGKVDRVVVQGTGCVVSGNVELAEVKGDQATVEMESGKVIVDAGVSGTTVNGALTSGGETVKVVPEEKTASSSSSGGGGSSGGGSTGGGGSSGGSGGDDSSDGDDSDDDKEVTYTVTFDSDGGSEVASQEVKKSGQAVRPEAPVKEGMVFYDWFYQGAPYSFAMAVTKDLSLQAIWGKEMVLDDEGEWKDEGTPLAAWSITDGWMESKIAPNTEEGDWSEEQGKAIRTGVDYTEDWTVETSLLVTEDMGQGSGLCTGMEMKMESMDGAMEASIGLQYVYDGEGTEAKIQVLGTDGQWTEVEGLGATVGEHRYKVQFHEGTVSQYLDDVLVATASVSEKCTSVQEMKLLAKTMGEEAVVSWKVPVVRYTEGEPGNRILVETAEELVDAAKEGGEAVLQADVALSTKLEVAEDFVLNGQGHRIYAENWTGETNTDKHLIGVEQGADVVLKDVILDSAEAAYGVNIYDNGEGLCRMENVAILNSKGSGITVNGSQLEATQLAIEGNGWGQSIDVSTRVEAPSTLILDDVSQLEGNAIIEDEQAVATVQVGGETWYADGVVTKDGSKYIYSADATGNSYSVLDAEGLQTVLDEAEDGAKVTLLDDMDVFFENPAGESAFVITKGVDIDGNGKMITTNGAGFWIKEDAKVRISDLTLEGSDATGQEDGAAWMGIGTYDQNKTVELEMENCTVEGFHYGFYFGAGDGTKESSKTVCDFMSVAIRNCVAKGFYAENLTDSVFDGCNLIQNGAKETGDMTEETKEGLSGMELNLKYGDYENITFYDCSWVQNGKNDGGALVLTARDDGAYGNNPASLQDVFLYGNIFGNNNKDLVLGKAGKENKTPVQVWIDDVEVTGSIGSGPVRVEDNRAK